MESADWGGEAESTGSVISVVTLVLFARTKRYRFCRAPELAMSLFLPFVLQLALGGFVCPDQRRHRPGSRH